MKESKRHVLVAEEPLAIRNAVRVLLATVEPRSNIPPPMRKRLEEIAELGCDGLVLDLRAVEMPYGVAPLRIRNVRGSQLGGVVVITCDVTSPMIVYEIEELCRPHFFLRHWFSSIVAFLHALF